MRRSFVPALGLQERRARVDPFSPVELEACAKRVIDVVLTLVVAPVALVVLVLAAAALKLEGRHEPVFFTQLRSGRDGDLFRLYKLRTMWSDPRRQPEPRPGAKPVDDPRVTPVGRWLRRTSLDELPQLYNVLRGEMSLVGPRPSSVTVDEHDLWQTERMLVLPGLTGLWQITARGESTFEDRCRLDIVYARSRSWRLDLVILARTVWAVVTGRGAR